MQFLRFSSDIGTTLIATSLFLLQKAYQLLQKSHPNVRRPPNWDRGTVRKNSQGGPWPSVSVKQLKIYQNSMLSMSKFGCEMWYFWLLNKCSNIILNEVKRPPTGPSRSTVPKPQEGGTYCSIGTTGKWSSAKGQMMLKK